MADSAKRVIEIYKEQDDAEEAHRNAIANYKRITAKIRETVTNKIFEEVILGNQPANIN
jgi:hypothetical protein